MVVALLLTREDKFHPESHALFVLLLFVTCCLPRPDLLSTEIANVKKACTALPDSDSPQVGGCSDHSAAAGLQRNRLNKCV